MGIPEPSIWNENTLQLRKKRGSCNSTLERLNVFSIGREGKNVNKLEVEC
jgi:hypothetical protein